MIRTRFDLSAKNLRAPQMPETAAPSKKRRRGLTGLETQ